MFIQLNENNEILASANFKVDNTFIETNKTIVRNCDGILIFEEDLNIEEETKAKQKEQTQTEINKLKQYLTNTDYKIIKNFETGEEIPNDIKQKRMEARIRINELEVLNG